MNNIEPNDRKDMRLLLLDHFINSMPVPVDRDYATHLLDRVIAEERLDQLDQLIDIESMTFNRWKPKDVAHFFDVVGKQYRELEQKLNDLSQNQGSL